MFDAFPEGGAYARGYPTVCANVTNCWPGNLRA